MLEKESDKSYPEFAKLLNQYLYDKDRSASWLAKSLSLSPSTVSKWISEEKRPRSFEVVGRIADAFNLNDEERKKLFKSAGYGPYWNVLSNAQENEFRKRLEQDFEDEETESQPDLTGDTDNDPDPEPNLSEVESISPTPQEELLEHESDGIEQDDQLEDIGSAPITCVANTTDGNSVSANNPIGEQSEPNTSSDSQQKIETSKSSLNLQWVLGGIIAIVLLVFIRWFSSGLNGPVSTTPTATVPSTSTLVASTDTPVPTVQVAVVATATSNAILTPTVTATLPEIISPTATVNSGVRSPFFREVKSAQNRE